MPRKTLTVRTVESLKPDPSRRIEYHDDKVVGLSLRITPEGARSWSLRYRIRRRLRRMTIGDASVIPLADAREQAREALRDVAKGKDPADQKRADRQATTIEELSTLYLEKWAKPRKKSWRWDDYYLRRRILPVWRHRAVVDIKRRDIRELVDDIAASGAGVEANRVCSLVSKLFMFALDQDLIESTPAVRIQKPTQERTRERVLTEAEIRILWPHIEGLKDDRLMHWFKLRLLTAQRGGEIVLMRWRDVDLLAEWWTIPASDAKNGLSHRVPLTPTALEILKTRRQQADAKAEYVFEGIRGKRQRRTGASPLAGVLPDFRPHDLRRTVSTMMASGGIPEKTIQRILNHAERGVTGIYNRYSYDNEKRQALTWWDQRLGEILKSDGAHVLPFGRSA